MPVLDRRSRYPRPPVGAVTGTDRALRAAGAFVIVIALMWLVPSHASAQWILTAYLGAASTRPDSLQLQQPARGDEVTISPVEYTGRSFDAPPYYGARLGYFFRAAPFLGVEGEFIHMKAYAATGRSALIRGTWRGQAFDGAAPIDAIVQHFSMSHGENFVLANLAVRYPFHAAPGARVRLVARAGAGPTVPHVESVIDSVADQHYQRPAVGIQVGAGIEVRLHGGLHAVAEYKFTHSHPRVDVADGAIAETRLNTHHGVFGLAWQF